jgi:hypothetical protein
MSIPNFPGAPDGFGSGNVSSQKSFQATWLLSLFLGVLGVDHFYLGKTKTGLIKLFTVGGFYVWAIVDVIQTIRGNRTDQYGNKIVPTEKEKKTATIVSIIFIVLAFVSTSLSTTTAPPSNSSSSSSNSSNDSSSNGSQIEISDMVEVGDGIGLDYQSAQDLWRAQGLFVLPAEDATGQDRIPFLDSGWVVLDQYPAAGEQVEAGSSITATVKKFTDD